MLRSQQRTALSLKNELMRPNTMSSSKITLESRGDASGVVGQRTTWRLQEAHVVSP